MNVSRRSVYGRVCMAILGVVAMGPGAEASPCLDAASVTVVEDVPDGQRIDINSNDNVTYDMRGVSVNAAPSSHLIDFENPRSICVTGAAAIARYPDGFDVTWQSVKNSYDQGGFHTTRPQSGTTTFDRIYVEGVEDGLMVARTLGDSSQKWILSHSYFKNVVDDSIENDGYRSGIVRDSLFEGTHMFYSARNSREAAHSVLIEDSLIGFKCKPDPRTDSYSGAGSCPTGTSTQFMFKLGGLKPAITMRNTIIHMPAVPRSGTSKTCLPSGTYENVTLIWTAGTPFPCNSLPSGVTLSTNIGVYEDARQDWFARHGCRSDGTDCAFLRRDGVVPDPDPGPRASAPTPPILLGVEAQ